MTVDDCRILDLPRINDPRGNLTFIEGARHVPFEIKRVYYLYDVPGGESRGGHAHRDLQQLIIAMSGSFDVVVDDGRKRRTFNLNRSYYGLYIPTMIWRELANFSSGSVCTVLASNRYDEADYYRDYDDFVRDATRAGVKDAANGGTDNR
ncbi:MAG: sugar 3,4-ketoisomerase [Thermoplasmatota archaeon]